MATDISVMGRSFSVLENTNDNFWARVNNGSWEPETFEIFDRFVDEDTLVIDFGAWIGPTVLFAAQSAGMTLAFEPDQAAFKTLRNNVDLNAEAAWSSRIRIFEEGIHASGKPITIGAPGKAGNSTSGSLFAGRKASWTIETHRLQDVIAKHRGDHKKIFVKMDIEGGEYDLIPEITDLFADPSITFYISFHQRILRGFIEARTGDEDAATEEYNGIMRKTYDCLPWDRTIERTNGKPFRPAMVKRRMANNRRLPPELVIY
ncbi:MAG: FkbM family methyltransferase [Rhodobacteraceae bacterium]|nr:FkbM family methyltransferase [Paracoccaceae bacterium]